MASTTESNEVANTKEDGVKASGSGSQQKALPNLPKLGGKTLRGQGIIQRAQRVMRPRDKPQPPSPVTEDEAAEWSKEDQANAGPASTIGKQNENQKQA
ncbi:uncharacterized protein MAM_07229 [Metarhizium album ARSEF 1941]|uniref:Uncharacterized protein n=1 Tax=Metarhizium album (strain ARSEF 1941) TaxID=1081103 RepID=A0A0B2WND7_METAS|nr:uncharacterized protein MAM_07229 [Metarhizium album ARSEF 1941]KHN95002.1 hypothetical protein MAM_07229 [Metarhizium album ARSEF 1941]